MSFRLETSRMASRNVGCFARSGHEISVFQAAYYNLHVWQNRIKKYRILFEIYIYISSRFFKTNLTKSAVIWVKSCQNAGFLRPISSKITPTKEKERRKSKSKERERRRREKTMVALLVFIMDTFFGRKKKLLDGRGLFGDNVFKNPARYILRS